MTYSVLDTAACTFQLVNYRELYIIVNNFFHSTHGHHVLIDFCFSKLDRSFRFCLLAPLERSQRRLFSNTFSSIGPV